VQQAAGHAFKLTARSPNSSAVPHFSPMRGEFIDLNGERIYYYAAGTRGVGDPIVLIHGFPTSSHIWFDVVPRLPQGHRVIVVDLPDSGGAIRRLAKPAS
jgi:pimeloyl-ACP methyl ester carboxylesterase